MQAIEICPDLLAQPKAPFFEKLKSYTEVEYDSWHTPGHASGEGFKGSEIMREFQTYLQNNLFKADLSVSVDELDSLLEPKGVIKEALEKAATTFGAKRTFFVTNGSSTSNKIILQALLKVGDKILLDRNGHMSAHQGAFLAGALPIYMNSSCNNQMGLFGPVSQKTIFKAIDENPDAKVLFLTSCTYDGLCYDLKPIIKYAHRAGLKVVIDEAWYAHGRFHTELPECALDCGADYVTQSTHKILNAFSQASMIHVNDPTFNERLFREAYSMHTSSSPNYLIIASLDLARLQMESEGYLLVDKMMKIAKYLREEINNIPNLKVLEVQDLIDPNLKNENIRMDPTKITIDISGLGINVEQFIYDLLEKHQIQIEKATVSSLTVLVTAGTTFMKAGRLIEALKLLAIQSKKQSLPIPLAETKNSYKDVPDLPAFGMLPREAQFAEAETLPLFDEQGEINLKLIGRVSSNMIIPKPPGIPVLIPGNIINRSVLEYLHMLFQSQKNLKILGLQEVGSQKGICVVKSLQD